MSTRLFAVLLAFFAAACAIAQSPEEAFRKQVLNQRFFLRGYSADPIIHLHRDGSAFVEDAPRFQAIAVFIPLSVKTKSDRIEISGERHTFTRANLKSPAALTPGHDIVHIDVDLRGLHPDQAYGQLPTALFFQDDTSAKDGLPDALKKWFPLSADPGSQSPRHAAPCPAHPDGTAAKVSPPHIAYAAEPDYSDEARRAKFSGNVMVYVSVDTSGMPAHPWVVNGAGLGLDQKALESAYKYRYRPASCDGVAVAVDIFVEVNFQIF